MGLKLKSLNLSGAEGRIDDLPFRLSAADDHCTIEIGASEAGTQPAWRRTLGLEVSGDSLSRSDIRGLVYRVVALYRLDHHRGLAAQG